MLVPEKRKVGGSIPPLTTHALSCAHVHLKIISRSAWSHSQAPTVPLTARLPLIAAGQRVARRRSSAPKADGSACTRVHRRLHGHLLVEVHLLRPRQIVAVVPAPARRRLSGSQPGGAAGPDQRPGCDWPRRWRVAPARCSRLRRAPLNLLAAMALWAGVSIDYSELHQEVLVIKAR